MKEIKLSLLLGVVITSVICAQAVFAAFKEPSMAEYTCYPIFQVNAVEPNILIILDNSNSMNEKAYDDPYDHNTEYYGYFEPYVKYSYASNLFTRNPGGEWDGNFLNWAVMRKIDVTRKVLMGGLATSRTGGGNQVNIGDTGNGVLNTQETYYSNQRVNVSLYKHGAYTGDRVVWFYVQNGYFQFWHCDTTLAEFEAGAPITWVYEGQFTIKVQKDITYADEVQNFVDGNLAGVLQKVGNRARWGNEFFFTGTGNNQSGGYIASAIGSNLTDLINDLQNTPCKTWTPLAEAYYVAMQYFKQKPVQYAPPLDYANNVVPCANVGQDPYYNGTEFVSCADAFVILLTDGASTMDGKIPTMYKDYADPHDFFVTTNSTVCDEDDALGSGCDFPSKGSDYLKDIALWARTNDLRSATVGKTELAGDQNMLLYTIYAFGEDENAQKLLKEAAKNGGFEDRNSNNAPDLQTEWDKNNDGVPDTYYEADNGYELEAKLIKAINDILERAASGTSVSVLAQSEKGEGTMMQAYFRPRITVGTEDIEWLGFLQSLWVDPYGNLREDTDLDAALDVTRDKIIEHFLDSGSGNTKIKRFSVSADEPYPDTETAAYEELELDDISPLWEGGKLLAQRSAAGRKIFTFVDKDSNKVVDEGSYDPFDSSGELVSFSTASAASIKPYLGVRDDSTWSYLGPAQDTRVTNLIQWVRGNDIAGLRKRSADWDGDGDTEVWKLGDIVSSSPVTVSKPPDNYHILYADESYQTYYDKFKDRETIVYVGANDGMLHAFTSYKYDSAANGFVWAAGTENMGDELWAYIPQNLLPHLKWLPHTSYTHVYYVDMKPKVFDAKILPDESHYSDPDADDNWGTILLVGFNLGGGDISALEDFDYNAGTANTIKSFAPTYVCMDVTDPRNPRLLWERTYQNLKKSFSFPAVFKVKDKWLAVFGSGPGDCDGSSAQNGYVYVVDLKTGDSYPDSSLAAGTTDGWLFKTTESKVFMGAAASLDKGMDYNVDAIYMGGAYDDFPNGWKGKMYKITVPWVKEQPAGSGTYVYDGVNRDNYIDNPRDAITPWRFSVLFNATKPITAPPAISVDSLDNTWIYFGTGRYLSTADKVNTDTQYLFGIKDPFFNREHRPTGFFGDNYYHNYASSLTLEISNLMNADNYRIAGAKAVYDGSSLIADYDGDGITGEYQDLLSLSRSKDGWIKTLTTAKERVVTKPAILGGTIYVTSFMPNDDVCGYGGESNLYGVYYETGTAYYRATFRNGTTTVNINGVDVEIILDKIDIGEGKASNVGLHAGMQDGATGFLQQSTGNILREELSPALNFRSGLRSWIER